MDRVRRKETIGNNPQCRTWSKKHDESEEKYLFPSIPVELIIEILLKLPAKSIAKFMFVSKYWSSIIRDKYFTELYLTRSFTRPRLLFAVHRKDMKFSYYGSLEDLSSDHHHRLTITTNHHSWSQFSPSIRGLICCVNVTKVFIGNPSTGQFVTLPKVKTKSYIIYSFFGYDPVNDLYKVLCMTRGRHVPSGGIFGSIWTEEHQVFTLGAKQKWRMIECKHRHRLTDLHNGKGTCMNGVLYYLAMINDEESRSLISFNLRSEDFSVIKLHEDIRRRPWSYNLVNYNGKIALTNFSCDDGTLELWVQKDASKQEWSKASSLLVPSWTNIVGNQWFMFRGTLSTGELIFEPGFSPKPFFLICYDLKENNARKVVIEGIENDYATVFLDHVESPMFLPNVFQSDDD